MASFNESHELEAVGDQSPDATDGLHVVHEYALTKSQQSREERDRAMLMRLGKNPVLKVRSPKQQISSSSLMNCS